MKKEDVINFVEHLKKAYPDATCSLDFETPFQMVIAVMLSAQCTDERVNKTTPTLFSRCKTIQDYIDIDISVLENFNGQVPDNMEDLQTLAGIGRKSANVVMLEAFGVANGIAVDTHAKRISNMIGLSKETDPSKIEQDLIKIFPKEYLKDINHLFVWHGRNTCVARKPKCDNCPVNMYCKNYKNKN